MSSPCAENAGAGLWQFPFSGDASDTYNLPTTQAILDTVKGGY